MPTAYARAFSPAQAERHAQIVRGRGGELAHAELCQLEGRSVCVVADDRPGLLSLITSALLVHGLGIVSAQAYCRRLASGGVEAVDFLELGPPRPSSMGLTFSVDSSEVAAFLQTLRELIAEDIEVNARASLVPEAEAPRVRVYFDLEALRRGEYLMLVEAPDSEGLLHAITSTLHSRRVRTLACQIGTQDGIAYDRFEISSLQGAPLTAIQLCDIQLAVLDALLGRRS